MANEYSENKDICENEAKFGRDTEDEDIFTKPGIDWNWLTIEIWNLRER